MIKPGVLSVHFQCVCTCAQGSVVLSYVSKAPHFTPLVLSHSFCLSDDFSCPSSSGLMEQVLATARVRQKTHSGEGTGGIGGAKDP